MNSLEDDTRAALVLFYFLFLFFCFLFLPGYVFRVLVETQVFVGPIHVMSDPFRPRRVVPLFSPNAPCMQLYIQWYLSAAGGNLSSRTCRRCVLATTPTVYMWWQHMIISFDYYIHFLLALRCRCPTSPRQQVWMKAGNSNSQKHLDSAGRHKNSSSIRFRM
jgi:hypothetical protein